MDARLRALCDLNVPTARESVGLHSYDGRPQDLSPDGVRSGLAALESALAETASSDNQHDEAHIVAAAAHARVVYGDLELHRTNPLLHVSNLDLACYDRDYAPEQERLDARLTHLEAWPDAIAGAIAALDAVPAPIARATIDAARGLAVGLDAARSDIEEAALAAHDRLVSHLENAARTGPESAALGADALVSLLSSAEAMPVDLAALATQADTERDRLIAMVTEACQRIDPVRSVAETVAALLDDHPDADGVLADARELTAEVIDWTTEHDLVPYTDGECLVGPAPESRRWAMAMMSWAAPYEADSASWYHVTPPDPSWPAADQKEWLQVFSRTALPAITLHEVAPGHFSHGRALRQAPTEVRRTLTSEAFIEGWAHYVEEMALEEGFRANDPRFAVGVAVEALIRVTRMSCAIGIHTGEMTVEEATERFTRDAFVAGPAALSEARRGTFDPTYGRYTWGKLAIMDLREQARQAWGPEFSLPRFHRALLELGSPPLGLMSAALGTAAG